MQGLQRRATPHHSELKVMKKGIEERRNEAYTSRADGETESPGAEVQHITDTPQDILHGTVLEIHEHKYK